MYVISRSLFKSPASITYSAPRAALYAALDAAQAGGPVWVFPAQSPHPVACLNRRRGRLVVEGEEPRRVRPRASGLTLPAAAQALGLILSGPREAVKARRLAEEFINLVR